MLYNVIRGSCPLSVLKNVTHVSHSHRLGTPLARSFLRSVLLSLPYLPTRLLLGEPRCGCLARVTVLCVWRGAVAFCTGGFCRAEI